MSLLKFTPALIASALMIACGSNPKPAELQDFEAKRVGEYAPEIAKNYPALQKEFDGYYKEALKAHDDDNKNMTLYFTDLADTTFRTAVSLLNQKDFQARKASAEERTNQAGVVLEKAGQRKEFASLKGQVAEVKVKDAELAILKAKSINAAEYAPEQLAQAEATFEKAKAAFAAGDTAEAQKIAETAIAQADVALKTAQPAYDKQAKINAVDAQYKKIMADAARIPSVTSRIEQRGLFISMRDLFQGQKTTVRGDKMVAIMEMAKIINNYPDFKILIEGHTDNKGKAAKLMEISENRAQTVASTLGKEGVAVARISTAGKGGTEPIDDNSKKAGREKNQRVEIIFLRPAD